MAIFTIADPHLSLGEGLNKSMEVFGGRWQDYTERLAAHWRAVVKDTDTVVLPGDISWGMTLDAAAPDFHFLDSLPGRKILGKGNHDFFWTTVKKMKEFFKKENVTTLEFLFNNAYEADGKLIAGTRFWFPDEESVKTVGPSDFLKMTEREFLRLETSLKAAKALDAGRGLEILVFLHFPPLLSGEAGERLLSILHEYGVRRVYYGHVHGNYQVPPVISKDGVDFSLISADFLEFYPYYIR